MSLDLLKAARDELATVITEAQGVVARHKGALEKLDGVIAAFEADLSKVPGVAELKALIARM